MKHIVLSVREMYENSQEVNIGGPLKYILGLSVYPEEILLALSGTISVS